MLFWLADCLPSSKGSARALSCPKGIVLAGSFDCITDREREKINVPHCPQQVNKHTLFESLVPPRNSSNSDLSEDIAVPCRD